MRDPTLTLAAYSSLERALNAALGLDVRLRQQVSSYAGKVIRLECTAPAIVAHVKLGETCSVLQHFSGRPDVGLSGDLQGWLALLGASDKAASLINSSMVISGDSGLLMALGKLGSELEIDWEAQLAEFVGDVPAHLAGRAARKSLQLGQQLSATVRQQFDAFIVEQTRLLPKKSEADAFYQRLRQLEMRIERLQASAKKMRAAQEKH